MFSILFKLISFSSISSSFCFFFSLEESPMFPSVFTSGGENTQKCNLDCWEISPAESMAHLKFHKQLEEREACCPYYWRNSVTALPSLKFHLCYVGDGGDKNMEYPYHPNDCSFVVVCFSSSTIQSSSGKQELRDILARTWHQYCHAVRKDCCWGGKTPKRTGLLFVWQLCQKENFGMSNLVRRKNGVVELLSARDYGSVEETLPCI